MSGTSAPRAPAGEVLVSACLLGRPCRYDGASEPRGALREQLEGWAVRAVCPEELGGLGTPRPAAELRGGDGAAVWAGRARVERVVDREDVSLAFTSGATAAALAAPQARLAVLKARSPSCGCGQTHIDGRVQAGDGVFAALLRARGVEVLSDEDPGLARRLGSAVHPAAAPRGAG